MTRVLITVSGEMAPDLEDAIAAGHRPRADYLELAAAMGADVIDHAMARQSTGAAGRILQRLMGPNVVLALACFLRRRQYDAILTDGEQVGLPYAALCRLARRSGLPRHHMVAHILSVRKKVVVWKALGVRRRVDSLLVYASCQREFAMEHLGMGAEAVHLTTFMVDTEFFSNARVDASPRRLIATAGLEFRDYETLVDAVRGLDIEVVIAAASPWSKRSSGITAEELPSNVTTTSLTLAELRHLYAGATLVVVPLREVAFQAGITTILEAMSMGCPVICSRTQGQVDTIVDGVTGKYVPPADPHSLRTAVESLLADPATASRLGAAARAWVEEHADIEVYARRIADIVLADASSRPPS